MYKKGCEAIHESWTLWTNAYQMVPMKKRDFFPGMSMRTRKKTAKPMQETIKARMELQAGWPKATNKNETMKRNILYIVNNWLPR